MSIKKVGCMNSYILLRNNQEYGPYSIKELKALGLQATDLLWIEGESRSWHLPEEIPALNDKLVGAAKTGTTSTSSTTYLKPFLGSHANKITNPASEPAYYFSERKEPLLDNYETGEEPVFIRKRHHKRTIGLGTGAFGFVVLLFGIALCVFMIKATIKSFGYEAMPSFAKEIKDDNVVTVSTNSYAAKSIPVNASVSSYAEAAKKDSVITTNNALKVAATPANEKAKPRLVAKPDSNESLAAKNDSLNAPFTDNTDNKTTDEITDVKPMAITKSSLQIAANNYKVGFLGGISNLQLLITNPSSEVISNATIVVEFLKPNGSIVKSQNITVDSVQPGGTKTIDVPSSNRGVKVRYHILATGE